MKNVVDVASFFFFPSIFGNLVATIPFFFLGNVIVTISFHFRHSPSMHFGHFTGRLGSTGRTRISVISLPKFNFLSPLIHCTFSCNFGNIVTEVQSLSSFCQITLNSTYNNNKLPFFTIFSQKTGVNNVAEAVEVAGQPRRDQWVS